MEFKAYVGNDIPLSLKALTLSYGLMQYWLMDRKDMVAVVAYENDVHVGWCAYRSIDEDIVEVGTFILPEYRNIKLGSRLLDAALYILSTEMPNAQVRYGGSQVPAFHTTYIRTIQKHGLKDIRWF